MITTTRAYRLAILSGALPMATGLIFAAWWMVQPLAWLPLAGIATIVVGTICCLVGLLLLYYVASRSPDHTKAQITRCLLLILANFPLAAVVLMAVVTRALHPPSDDVSTAERLFRFARGEALAAQIVNDDAHFLENESAARELEAFADDLFIEYATASLPSERRPNYQIPVSRLPSPLHTLGGTHSNSPEVILRVDDKRSPTAVRLEWGNGRHLIVVFKTPPAQRPESFHTRRISPRIYVIANES